MNHCLRIFFSAIAPERHDFPSLSICSLASTVWSTGSQLTSAFVYFNSKDISLLKSKKLYAYILLFARPNLGETFPEKCIA